MAIEVDPARWDDLLRAAGIGDAYYLRGYLEGAAAAAGGRCAYLHVAEPSGAVFFPCVIRDIPGATGHDATTVAFGGPLSVGPRPPLDAFSARYEDWCAVFEIISTFVRFHPLFANHLHAPAFLRTERVEPSVAWTLEGDLLRGMHPHHQRLVRKARASGVEVAVTVRPPDLSRFAALYDETLVRLGASPFYFFDDEYWEALLSLGDHLVLVEGRRGGNVIAAVLCFATHPWLHYHLGATSDEARTLGASHLLLYSAARFGQDAAYEQFNLGSGVGAGGGSLLEFKRRFTSDPPREQWFGKAVHDVARYLELTNGTAVDYGGFFPAYRRVVGTTGEPAPRDSRSRG
jgi:hypothetical protein